jgi:putative endonuclease
VTYFVYVLRSTVARRTYVGMTSDLERRLRQHNGELAGGARYTRVGRPWEIKLVLGPYPTRSHACRVEWRAKRFRGAERFKVRAWVSDLDDNAKDKDAHLHFRRRRRRRWRVRRRG